MIYNDYFNFINKPYNLVYDRHVKWWLLTCYLITCTYA